MTEALGDIDDFDEVCQQQAWLFDEGLVPLQTAVDNLQHLAELWGLVADIGQDAVQSHMAAAFALVRGMVPQLPSDYAAQLVKSWEIADPRDRWRHTGELPPQAAPVRSVSHVARARPAASTIDAFNCVASLGDAKHLARWLADHRDVADLLLEQFRRAA